MPEHLDVRDPASSLFPVMLKRIKEAIVDEEYVCTCSLIYPGGILSTKCPVHSELAKIFVITAEPPDAINRLRRK
jgi:hypothetical protein